MYNVLNKFTLKIFNILNYYSKKKKKKRKCINWLSNIDYAKDKTIVEYNIIITQEVSSTVNSLHFNVFNLHGYFLSISV